MTFRDSSGSFTKGLLLVICVSGCAEATFSAHSRDNQVDDIKRVLAASKASPSGNKPMAFLVTSGPEKQLVGFDLTDGKVAWKEPADVRSRVLVARGLIAHRQGEAEIVARDPATGRTILTLRLPPAERFIGVAADDARLYYVTQSSGEAHRVSTVVAVDRTGKELWRAPAGGSLGAPAARGGVLAVPYAYQNVSFLDGATGRELARVRATDEQITFVRALPSGFFYGGAKGVYLLDEKSATGTRQGSSFAEVNLGSDQVRTFYSWDAYTPAQADYTAFDRNRLLWRAEPHDGTLGFSDDVAFLHSYRYFFAFDVKRGKLRWAYAHPRVDVVSAEDVGPSLLGASVDGDVVVIDARSGAVRATWKTGLKIAGATFDADGFSGGSDGKPGDLLKTLEQIVWDHDARFTAVKVFAVDAMGDVAGKEASAALLKVILTEGVTVPPAVRKKAGEELIARHDKEALPLYLEALRVRFDFLEDKHPLGLDVLARTVAAIDAKEAAPELAAHLVDYATPQPALKEVAAALAGLGGAAAVAALREFLLTYRADPMFIGDPASLTIAAEGLLKSGGPEERRTVSFVAEEKRTISPVGLYLKKVLAGKR
jgi:outer membrane protein assembly factor BamB